MYRAGPVPPGTGPTGRTGPVPTGLRTLLQTDRPSKESVSAALLRALLVFFLNKSRNAGALLVHLRRKKSDYKTWSTIQLQ
jgi:hypothetical protein